MLAVIFTSILRGKDTKTALPDLQKLGSRSPSFRL
jgi:hypothetical protein